ncbi:MAG: TlpA disulfide reductase family protein [Chitinophagaceae bacterium]
MSLIILFCCCTNSLFAQKGFGDCILKSLTNIDSTVGDTIYNAMKWQNCVLDKPLPEIEFTTVSKEDVALKKLRGKVIALNFWFTACAPCIAEIPALNKLVQDYAGKDVVFFGITYDSYSTLTSKFFPNYKFDFQIVCDVENITEAFSAGYPTTYIIDKEGIVRSVWNGGFTGKEAETAAYLKAKPVIDELLSEP